MTKKILTAFAFAAIAATGAAGCGKKSGSCEEVFEHIKSLTPAEMRDLLDKTKDGAIEKCKSMSEEARSCALAAKSMEDLQKCPKQ
jgi:hypothetical protein